MRLSQVIAVEKSVKNKSNNDITAAYHEIQKTALFAGISRLYQPKDEEGERYPPENQKVQRKASELLTLTAKTMTHYWDTTLTKDSANCDAVADVVVDGVKILEAAPVTFLLFLEKQLTDVATYVKKLPTLDQGESWNRDEATDTYATAPSQTVKTKKVPKAFVKAEATKEHPAQVETFQEDIVIGTWTTTKYSGGVPQARVTEILERVTKLQAAVKMAREEANTITVTERAVGDAAFRYLFGA
jgi:hypothetical protein